MDTCTDIKVINISELAPFNFESYDQEFQEENASCEEGDVEFETVNPRTIYIDAEKNVASETLGMQKMETTHRKKRDLLLYFKFQSPKMMKTIPRKNHKCYCWNNLVLKVGEKLVSQMTIPELEQLGYFEIAKQKR